MEGIFDERLGAELESFLAEEKPKVSVQGYETICKLARAFCTWLEEEELEIGEVGLDEALRYQVKLSTALSKNGKPYNAGTINNHLKAARRFYDYLTKEGLVKTNPFRALRRVKVGEHLSENSLSVEEMGRLLAALSHFDEESPRWKALKTYRVHVAAELMYSCGLHASEAAAIEPGDLDLDTRTVWVRSGRSGQGRTAFLNCYAAGVLAEYLKVRPLLLGEHERGSGHTLFGTGHARLTVVINEVLAQVCAQEGLPMITSYGFRTSLGAHLTQGGCDLRHVQLLVGFQNLGSTRTYLRRDKESLRAAVDAAHPRGTWEAKS